MRIALIAWYFPPSNTIAAVRLGKLAKYLAKSGHDLRVVTAENVPYAPTLPVEIPEEWILRTDWTNINAIPSQVKTGLKWLLTPFAANRSKPAAPPGGVKGPPKGTAYYGGKLSRLYQLLFNLPDERIGWLLPARRAALEHFQDWRPDVIFASAPPFTSLLIGYSLSRATGIPLVVEFRDRWSDDPYYPPPSWRRLLERSMERIILRRATAITTVSEPWAENYRARHGKPVAVIYNGYDPADQLEQVSSCSHGGWPDPGVLRIVHTGGIYRGRRDPSPLFDAISRHQDLKQRVKIAFYGLATDYVPSLARDYGIEECVEIHSRVEHTESVRQQRQSDVLLLMQMNSPLEQGNVPGKFFEYLGARRPILVLGWDEGVPATIVRERGAGAATTDPEAIGQQLRTWLEIKAREGWLPDLPEEVCLGFTHNEQTRRLEEFLQEVLAT